MERLLGAHVSIAGGLPNAIENGVKLGCNVIQIFGSSPRVWSFKMPPDEEVEEFNIKRQKEGIKQVFLHSIYLINLASPSEKMRKLSIQSLINYLNLGIKIDAQGVITHIGTATGTTQKLALDYVASSINKVLNNTRGGIHLLLEVTAGSGNTIGSRYEHLKDILNRIGDKGRIGFCWDTAHTFESGYDIAKDLDGVLEEFDSSVGIEKLKVVHFNDSKTKFNSKVDRHENLGEGEIGYEALKNIINHPQIAHLPFIIETPGFKNEGPDKKNMEIMKRMIEDTNTM